MAMDPLSLTVAALGITDFAISRFNELRGVIDDIKEAKEELNDVQSSLENITSTLDALGELGINSTDNTAVLEDLKKTRVSDAVNSCSEACEAFSKNIKKWRRKSGSERMSFRERFLIGVWKKETIRTLRTRVQGCQATVQFAVASCQLYEQSICYVVRVFSY